MARKKNQTKNFNQLTSEPDLQVSLVPYKVEEDKNRLERFLEDSTSIEIVSSLSSLGCSVGTIAAKLGVPYSRLLDWLEKGKLESSTYDPDFCSTPYMELWSVFSEGMSTARQLAEGSLAQRDPERFLRSKASKLISDEWIEEEKAQEEEKSTSTSLPAGEDFIESLKAFRAMGYDLNDIIDKDSLQMRLSPPPVKKEDVLKANGLVPNVVSSLPKTVDGVVQDMPVILGNED